MNGRASQAARREFRQRRIRWTGLFAGIALAMWWGSTTLPAPARAAEAEIFEVTIPMGPICLDGAFALEVLVEGDSLEGTATLTTDPAGRLTGEFAMGDELLPMSGKVRHREDGSSVNLVIGSGPAKVKLKGSWEVGGFAGTTRGGGKSIAPGRNDFMLLAGDGEVQQARITAALDPESGRKVEGEAEVFVCNDPLELVVKGTRGDVLHLDLRSSGFRWKAVTESSGDTVSWNVKGYGAKRSGEALPLAPLLPPTGLSYPGGPFLLEQEEPSAALEPTLGGGRVDAFAIEPALPEGLALDPVTGIIEGTPEVPVDAAIYTVTASNAAGQSETTLDLAVRVQRAYSLASHAEPLTDDDLRHFLVRTHFGVRVDELDALVAAGLPGFVDAMLDFTPDPALEAEAAAYLASASDPPGLEGGFPSGNQLARWWSHLLMHTDKPFRENLSLFWQDHFAVTADTLNAEARYWMVHYVNLFRERGAGNLRSLLVDVARDPAMLDFLDGHSNAVGRPNENFAREFWELYTLGVDNGYTQEDIVEAARAFTGYRPRLNGTTGQHESTFQANRHDPGSKTIFGVVIPAQSTGDDFQAVADITLAQRPVAEFIVRKLLRWYCHDDPADVLVDALAEVLRANDYELAPTLRTMFLSEAFFSKRSRRALVKSPLDLGVGFIRSTGLVIAPPLFDFYARSLGQRPTEPPTVNGWPDGTLWLSAAAMVDRTNLAQAAILDVRNQERAGISIVPILPPPGQRSAGEVVDHFAALLRVDLSPEDRIDLVTFLTTLRLPDGTVVPSPFNADDEAQQDDRVRGLLYILAQHPSYHLR